MDANGLIEVDDIFRLKMVDGILDWLSRQDDPRALDAVAHYQAQREELAKRIQANNPPPVTVQANVATLGAAGGNHAGR